MIVERVVVSPFETNCYIVGAENNHAGMIVDPGDGSKQILQKVVRSY